MRAEPISEKDLGDTSKEASTKPKDDKDEEEVGDEAAVEDKANDAAAENVDAEKNTDKIEDEKCQTNQESGEKNPTNVSIRIVNNR